MKRKICINDGWMFLEKEYSRQNLEVSEGDYEPVTLPHDYLIYDVKNLYRDSIGWYKRKLVYVPDELERVLFFEGVYMDSEVFINGTSAGTWKYGYSSFEVNITPYLVEGENEILVRVVHQSPNSRWYSGAGIYRSVYLIERESTHIASSGLYITPVKRADSDIWDVDVEVQLEQKEEKEENARFFDSIRYTIIPKSKESSITQENNDSNINHDKIYHFRLEIANPRLWDIYQGNLYEMKVELIRDGKPFDYEQSVFGFRTIALDAREGFFLNGRHVKLKGSCEHHGFGCLGAAVNKSAVRRKLEHLKKMGVNAIRTAHNMPSVEFMELADEMGFLVDSEAFDMWGHSKTNYDYGRFFAENYKKDVASWIRRDRNHPSIIMWSVGNEIYDMHAGDEGMEELRMLLAEVKRHDPKKHAFTTFASNYMRWENTQKCGELVDAVGYNYGEYLYEEHHAKHPDWVIYGSETGSMLASRAVYHFPIETGILCDTDEQCSALGNCSAGWGAHRYTDNIIADRDAAYSLGQFIWAGVDYFGEPTPYHTRNSYFGQMDTAGFEKDSYYIYQAEWTSVDDNPMVHVFPHWDFNPGQVVDVCVCSNAPCVELFVNGESKGKKFIDHEHGTELVPHWKVVYEPGYIEAVAYDKSGKVLARQTRHSFSDADRLVMSADRQLMENRYGELIFVEIGAVDKEGYPVDNANNRVEVRVSGAGRLVGMDNGDSTDFDQVKADSRRLFGGRLLAVIAPVEGETGEVTVTARAAGLKEASIKLAVVDNQKKNNDNERQNNKATSKEAAVILDQHCSENAEIPIRKIELHAETLNLSSEKRSVNVFWKIYPENATYKDLIWSITDATGIAVKTASITYDDCVTVSAAGDGSFYLRCDAYNGRSVAGVKSCLEFKAEGIGPAYINPYEAVSAGLCLERPYGLSEGVEHGVRFLGKEMTRISFGEMDFGTSGSGKIQMYLFKYYPGAVHFRMYLDDGDYAVLEGSFDESAGWLEFKRAEYELAERIKGIHRISIESEDNFQLNRFAFIPALHGFDHVAAADYDEIFGDSYKVNGTAVTDIGNNVSIIYRHLNMGSQLADRIKICGKTDNPKDSIHLKLSVDGTERTELIEFANSEETVEQEFMIEPVKGEITATFLFLPGCSFELDYFQFGCGISGE